MSYLLIVLTVATFGALTKVASTLTELAADGRAWTCSWALPALLIWSALLLILLLVLVLKGATS